MSFVFQCNKRLRALAKKKVAKRVNKGLQIVTFLKEGGGKLCCSESISVKIVNLIVEFYKSIANMVCLSRISKSKASTNV